MSLLENNKELHGFGDSIRRLYVTVTDLKCFQIGNGMSPIDDEGITPCVTGLFKGTASIEDDALMIIGSDKEPIKQLSITIRPFNDWIHLNERWDEHLKETGEAKTTGQEVNDDFGRIKQYLQNVHNNRFNEQPPTASVGFYKNWFIECDIHQEIFNKLTADFINGSCEQIRIAIEMHPTLIDNEYADRSESVVFGVLDWDAYGSSGFGYTTSLTWEKNPTAVAQSLQMPNKEKAANIINGAPHALQLADDIKNVVIKELASVNFSMRIGLILLFLLVITVGFS